MDSIAAASTAAATANVSSAVAISVLQKGMAAQANTAGTLLASVASNAPAPSPALPHLGTLVDRQA